MPLADIQRQLQSLYDVSLEHRVEDYLVTDRSFIDAIKGRIAEREAPEKLVFTECDGELLVSLYLDEELIQGLSNNDPYDRLHSGNLGAFCTVLEGVSHFVYLVFNATHERPVSQLELELQAEVDKFFVVRTLCARQGRALDHDSLSNWLFDRCRFDPGLDALERSRYETANRLARAFCNRVGELGAARESADPVYTELRRFYRKRHFDKIDSATAGTALRGP